MLGISPYRKRDRPHIVGFPRGMGGGNAAVPVQRAVLLSEFREFLDGFSKGGRFSVAVDPDRKKSDAIIARVHPVKDEFWDFRVTAPKPGIVSRGVV